VASRNASFHDSRVISVLLVPLKWFCISVMILLGLVLAAWIIDWIFVFRVWPDGIARLQSILEQDIARTYRIECWYSDLPALTAGMANFLYALIFRVTGIHEMGTGFAEVEALSIPDTIVRSAYLENFEAIRVAMLGTQIMGVRLATLVIGLPLLILTYAVAMTDGLVQRAIRRVSGGRESSSIYHRAKYLQIVLIAITIAIFLLWPASIDFPAMLCMAMAIAAVLARVQWSYYKKHF
jgi:integrating conjugative element membrane protein (TIGR03747 family)